MEDTYVALLRAVNVGGTSLATKDFVRVLEKLQFREIRTYIQSGNAVFRTAAGESEILAERIRGAMQKELDLATEVILLRAAELDEAIKGNSFPEANSDPKALHVFFLAVPLSAVDFSAIEKYRDPSEHYLLKGRVLYFFAPKGMGRSKFAQRLGKMLGVPSTARNWRTVCKLGEIAQGLRNK